MHVGLTCPYTEGFNEGGTVSLPFFSKGIPMIIRCILFLVIFILSGLCFRVTVFSETKDFRYVITQLIAWVFLVCALVSLYCSGYFVGAWK